MRKISLVILLALTIVVITLCAAQPKAQAATSTPSMLLTLDEQSMVNMINDERAKRGLKQLKVDNGITAMARSYAHEMVTYDFFAHTSPISGTLDKRFNRLPLQDWTLAGENLAGACTVDIAFDALMNSPSHKMNILEPRYTHLGVGVIDSDTYGKVFVQEFIAYKTLVSYKKSTTVKTVKRKSTSVRRKSAKLIYKLRKS